MSRKSAFGWTLIAVLSAFFVLFSGSSVSLAAHHEEPQTTASDVKREALETYDTFKKYTLEQRDKAIEAADKRLAAIDENLDAIQKDLDKRWQAMSEATRKKNREVIRKLNKERENVAEWYGGMRHSSAEAWETSKKGFLTVMTAWKEPLPKQAGLLQKRKKNNVERNNPDLKNPNINQRSQYAFFVRRNETGYRRFIPRHII